MICILSEKKKQDRLKESHTDLICVSIRSMIKCIQHQAANTIHKTQPNSKKASKAQFNSSTSPCQDDCMDFGFIDLAYCISQQQLRSYLKRPIHIDSTINEGMAFK